MTCCAACSDHVQHCLIESIASFVITQTVCLCNLTIRRLSVPSTSVTRLHMFGSITKTRSLFMVLMIGTRPLPRTMLEVRYTTIRRRRDWKMRLILRQYDMKDYHVLIQVDITKPAEVSQKVCRPHSATCKNYEAKSDRSLISPMSHGQASNFGPRMRPRRMVNTTCSSLPRIRKAYSGLV